MKTICPVCNIEFEARNGDYNRAIKQGYKPVCGRVCAGIKRRNNKTPEQRKKEKAEYDIKYRAERYKEIQQKKREYFQRTYDPEKARVERKKRMPKHIEYCRQPEYRKKKKVYDRQYRNVKKYGKELGECMTLALKIRDECLKQMSDYEIRLSKGTINKLQKRKRDYERLNSNKLENSPLGDSTAITIRR